MSNCQCKKVNGTLCTRSASTKEGLNPLYCWQHQDCQSAVESQKPAPIGSKKPAPMKPSGKKPISATELLPPKSDGDIHPIVRQMALAVMGDTDGKIYTLVAGGMGGFYVIKRDFVKDKLVSYWSYDDQYTNYVKPKAFIKGYRPADSQSEWLSSD